jgi:hypothetical protein
MLLRNRVARDVARRTALCLICIRKFRPREAGLLGLVPKELVTMIAKDVFDSYADPKWQEPKPKAKSRRKRVRR